MKINKNIYYFLIIIFSISISYFLWSSIKFPLNNFEIVGNYSQNNYNANNEYIRYFLFILIPSVCFFCSKLYFEKKNISLFFNNFKSHEQKKEDTFKFSILFIIIILILLEFLSISFPLNKIDIFHDGQQLSSFYKNKSDGSLWSGSYVVVGVFYEILVSKFLWDIFSINSIGLIKFTNLFYILISKLILVFFILEITKKTNLPTFSKRIFFLIFNLILLNFIDYNLNSGQILSFREIPILLTLILFFNSINTNKVHNYIFIGIIAVLTFFWSIDRAVVLNFFLLFLLIYLLINKKNIQIFALAISVLFSWLIVYLILNDEFSYFIQNTISVIKEHSYVNGIIHPIPFSGEKDSARASKHLIAILLTIILSINIFFKKKNKYPYSLSIILFSLSIFSILSYIYALGRSDGPHIKQTLFFPSIFLILFFLNKVFILISQNKYKFKKINHSLIYIPIIILYILIINLELNNISNFKERFVKYIKLEDSNFLNDDDLFFINEASNLFKKEKCIQLFTNDSALLYLLKKPSCSKFYFAFSIGSIKNQNIFINELKNANFIVLNGRTDNWVFDLKVKYPNITSFIEKNYEDYKKIGNRLIKIKKN